MKNNKYLPKKLVKPMNPLIWNTTAEFAAVWFEAALSSGLERGKYVGRGDKPIRMFVQDHIEKFLPMTISILIEMLKPTSNCTPHMREEIYEALMDPVNDPELMDIGRNTTKSEQEKMLERSIKDYDKRAIKGPVQPMQLKPDTVIHMPPKGLQ